MEIETIYREVAPKLANYLTGNGLSYAETCDVVQETFLRLWERRDELTDDPGQVSGLVFTIARNYRNDLARRTKCELVGIGDTCEGTGTGDARPEETGDEIDALRRRLKVALGRMPVHLLEVFALSRLGSLTADDIARGTGLSENNVRVRITRARKLFLSIFRNTEDGLAARAADGTGDLALVILKAMMLLAAADGEIAKEELTLYRELADECRKTGLADFDGWWERSVRGMSCIGFMSETLAPEDLAREFVRETGDDFAVLGPRDLRRALAALDRMASADGEYSHIERGCVRALRERLGKSCG